MSFKVNPVFYDLVTLKSCILVAECYEQSVFRPRIIMCYAFPKDDLILRCIDFYIDSALFSFSLRESCDERPSKATSLCSTNPVGA